MTSFLRPQSAGEILRNSFHVFRTNFGVLFFGYVLPFSPLAVVNGFASSTDSALLAGVNLVLLGVAGLLGTVPITLILSDICLGNKPEIGRAYRRMFARAGPVLVTSFLQFVIIFAGLLLCVVPGLIFGAWYAFATIAVILEGRSGHGALARSKALGQGYYWRTLVVQVLLGFLILVLSFAIVIALGAIGTMLDLDQSTFDIALGALAQLISLMLQPIAIVATILMYYDLRVRKEAYDNAALAEDLRR